MKNKILVTGANGNIGKHIVRLLKDKDAEFVVGTSSNSIDGVNSVPIDFADIASLEKAMNGVSTLFMLMPAHPDTAKWGRDIISAAKKSGVKHIVRSSSDVAYKSPSYEFMKLIQETDRDVMNSGLNYTITAPQFFMQNFSTLLADDYKNGVLYLPAGEGKVVWVDVRDIAAVNVEVLLNPEKFNHQTLTITGSEAFSYREAVNQMNEILGKKSQYVAVPDDAAVKGMEEKHFPPFFVDVMMNLSNAVAKGHANEVTDTVEEVTGEKPISFKQFVADNREIWL